MADTPARVTRADIEARLRAVQGELSEAGESARQAVVLVAAAGAVLVLGIVYALGKRRGSQGRAVVEIRRV